MRSGFTTIVLVALTATLGDWVSPQRALAGRDPYWSGTDPGNIQPPTAPPWNAGTGPATPDGNGHFWVAITNGEASKKTKTWTFTFGGTNLEAVETKGYKEDGTSVEAAILSDKIVNGKRVVKCYYDPQPEWEVLKLHVTGGRAAETLERSDGACKESRKNKLNGSEVIVRW